MLCYFQRTQPPLAAEREETVRKYQAAEKKLMQTVCNKCGKALKVADGDLREGCVHVEAAFGYFSRKDGQIHRFDLCEDCYDELIARFAVAVEREERNELL